MIKQSGLDLQIKYKDEGYRLVWRQVKLDVEEWEQRVHQAPPVSTIRWKKTYSEELDVAPSQEVSDWYGSGESRPSPSSERIGLHRSLRMLSFAM